jgi:hypothetical protein
MLGATDLAVCNAGARGVSAQLPVHITPLPGMRAQAPSDQSTINTPELSLVGGARVDLSDRSGQAQTIDVGELSFVGGAGADLSDRSAPPVELATPELAFVGGKGTR